MTLSTRESSVETSPLSSADQVILDELWRRKHANEGLDSWMGAVVAELAQDVQMHVWNGKHPVDANTTAHTAKKGTTVLIWMMSRLGDIGITDRMDAHGYDVRVDPSAVVNWRFK